MLTIRGLSHVYPDGFRALDGVDLDVPAGFFGLLGPNGAGKSTLMRCIATLQEPSAGSLAFDGVDVVAEPDRIRRTLGYLPQDFGVYPGVTVRAMLDHMAVLKGVADRGERRALVESLLHRVNLWPARDRALAGFSGGMRQRFGVAQALIGGPRLLILDEPTAGLDPEERNRLLDLLAEAAEGAVVILSTHIVEDVADLCGRAAILAGGRIRRTGNPSGWVRELSGRVWRRFAERTELNGLRASHDVLSARLIGGRTLIHVLADTRPDPAFERAESDLSDAYFAALSTTRHAA